MSRTYTTIRYNALERKALAHGYSDAEDYLPHTPHHFPTCIWLRCTHPALLSEIRYGQRIIKRAHATATPEETTMLRHMAADASNTISILLADLTTEYTISGPLRRHLIASANTIAEHATTQLASIANPPKKQS